MITNKTRNLVTYKQRFRAINTHSPTVTPPLHQISMVPWEQEYYHSKDRIHQIQIKNQQIKKMIEDYRINPSVYNLKQLQKNIKLNCEEIDQVEAWINHFQYNKNTNSAAYQLEKNICSHCRSLLSDQIKKIFVFRHQIGEISSQILPREQSFNAFNQSSNISYRQLNNSKGEDRNEVLKEVSNKIENLNLVLRRMGGVVSQQGDLINRIDSNLVLTKFNVQSGKNELKERQGRQEGGQQGEFNCYGKINKAILVLYIINLALIFLLVIKNM